MPDVLIYPERPVPLIVPRDMPSMSDDECLVRLAQAVADHDSDKLDEVASADRAPCCDDRIELASGQCVAGEIADRRVSRSP